MLTPVGIGEGGAYSAGLAGEGGEMVVGKGKDVLLKNSHILSSYRCNTTDIK